MMLKTRWRRLCPSLPNPSLHSPSPSLGPSHFVIVYFSDQALKPPPLSSSPSAAAAEIVSVFGFVGRMDRSFVRGFSHKLQVTLSKSGSLGSRPIPKRCRAGRRDCKRKRGIHATSPKTIGSMLNPPLPCHCERVSDESG